jgi:membrane-bound lytic murein transglycosylase D
VNSLNEDARLQFGDKLIIPVTPGQSGRGPAGASGSRIRYIVQRGDTLASIARDFDVTVAQVRKWNRLTSRTKLRPGRTLSILTDLPTASTAAAQPPKRSGSNGTAPVSGSEPIRVVHRVKKGDTLHTIATNYNISINSIRDWNNLSQDGSIRIGERLTIYVQR